MKEIKINKKKFYCGLFLIVLGILTPSFITEKNINFFPNLSKVSGFQNMDLIMSTGFSLVVMNTIRAIPHYLGSYILVDSIEQTKRSKRLLIFKYILIFENVLVRADEDFALEMHVDIEEGNACGLKNGDLVELIKLEA